MGKCGTCGTEIPDGTTFCGNDQYDPGKSIKIDRAPDETPSPRWDWGTADADDSREFPSGGGDFGNLS